jgi:hypothetical protein
VQIRRVTLDVDRLDAAEAAGHRRAGRERPGSPAGDGKADRQAELIDAVAHTKKVASGSFVARGRSQRVDSHKGAFAPNVSVVHRTTSTRIQYIPSR